MKYEKGKDGSHLHNCFVSRRNGDLSDQLFNQDDGTVTAFLNGYAVIPIEDYSQLVKMASPQDATLRPVPFSMALIRAANKDIYGTAE